MSDAVFCDVDGVSCSDTKCVSSAIVGVTNPVLSLLIFSALHPDKVASITAMTKIVFITLIVLSFIRKVIKNDCKHIS
jgi:hypothetical protein